MFSCGLLHKDKQVLGDQLEPIYNSSVLIEDVTWKTYWERWTIETNSERGSRKSVQVACHDDDDDDDDLHSLYAYGEH